VGWLVGEDGGESGNHGKMQLAREGGPWTGDFSAENRGRDARLMSRWAGERLLQGFQSSETRNDLPGQKKNAARLAFLPWAVDPQ
jgi:hypothetical protein